MKNKSSWSRPDQNSTTRLLSFPDHIRDAAFRVGYGFDNPLPVLFTTLFGMAYLDIVFAFSVTAPAELSMVISALRPGGKTFFILVLFLIAIHFVAVCTLSILFIFGKSNGQLGNAWAVVAQLKCKETDHLLEVAKTMKDAEVRRVLVTAGEDKDRIALTSSGGELRFRKTGPRREEIDQ